MRRKLAIIGPGALGLSLARWAAECGLEVAVAGRDLEHVERRLAESGRHWERSLGRGRITPLQLETARKHLCAVASWEAASVGASWVVEALPERLEAKAEAWASLDPHLSPETVRLTATSSLSVASIRQAAGMGPALAAFHAFLPMEHMAVVELVAEAGTAPEALEGALELAFLLRKQVARVLDQPGFCAARMALAQGLEAMRLLEQGIASAEDLDALMVQGYGHPAGPLELSDRVGLDLRLTIARQIFQATGDPRFEPPSILCELVRQGRYGRKSGHGFFRWDHEGRRR